MMTEYLIQVFDFIKSHLPLIAGCASIGMGVLSAIVGIVGKIYRDRQTEPFVTLGDQDMIAPGSVRRSAEMESRQESRQERKAEEVPLRSYQLVLQDLKHPGKKYTANMTERITIGRREDCVICIQNLTLSGIQCEIILNNGHMMLRDTGSHNGTYLNGGKTRVTEIELQSGDVLEMGSETLRVCVQAL
jgi:hypothetical protein